MIGGGGHAPQSTYLYFAELTQTFVHTRRTLAHIEKPPPSDPSASPWRTTRINSPSCFHDFPRHRMDSRMISRANSGAHFDVALVVGFLFDLIAQASVTVDRHLNERVPQSPELISGGHWPWVPISTTPGNDLCKTQAAVLMHRRDSCIPAPAALTGLRTDANTPLQTV